MTVEQLIEHLSENYAPNMPIKLLLHHEIGSAAVDFTEDHILHTSDTAYVDTEAPEEEHNTEDGKVELGDGQQYLLFNPIIL